MVKKTIAIVLMALVPVGCTVGPNYQKPDAAVKGAYGEMPPSTQPSVPTDRAEPVAEWWTTLRDPELDHLVAEAVKGNLNLQQSVSRIRESRAELVRAGADQYPTVKASANYARIDTGTNALKSFGFGGSSSSSSGSSGSGTTSSGSSGSGAINANLFQGGLDATWELDIFGGTRRNIEAAAADWQASIEDQRDVTISLVAEVAGDYLQLRGMQQRYRIAQENLRTQQDTLELTQSRFHAGFTTDLDVTRAQTQVEQTRASLPPLEAQIRQAIHALSTLVGEEPDALSAELEQPAAIPAVPPVVEVGLPSELLRRRPDIRREERELAAANARIGAAIADYYPKFSLTGQFGFDAPRFQNTFDWESRYLLLNPGISWTIFDAHRIGANVEAQREAHRQALLGYQDSVLTALKEVEDALVAYRTEQSRRASLSAAARSAQETVDISRQRYKQGVLDFLSVLDAQRQLFSVQDELVQSDEAIDGDLVALYKALGGGWEVPRAD